MKRETGLGLALAAAGVLFFSPGAVFIRMAAGVSAWEMSSLRLVLGALVMGVAALATKTSLRPAKGEFPRLAIFGLITALHFWAFTAGVERTAIAHALALCYTAPVFAGIFARLFLKERLRPIQWLGILLVVCSVAFMSLGGQPQEGRLLGDLLALISGVMLGIYHTVGRWVRHSIPLYRYTFWVYLLAGLYLAPLAWPYGSTYSSAAIAGILCQALLCTAGGHTLVNAALRKTRTAYVSLITTQEVTGGILLGALFLHEIPPRLALYAFGPLMIGLALVLAFPDRTSPSS